jgi:hypothetical protein
MKKKSDIYRRRRVERRGIWMKSIVFNSSVAQLSNMINDI